MTSFEFTSLGEHCHGRYRQASESSPVVVMATGGSKNGSLSQSWTNFPVVFETYGLSSIVFDFAGQGESEGDRRSLTLTKGVQNLSDVLEHISHWDWINSDKLALMGSSFGGNVVLDYLASEQAMRICGASLKSPCIDLRESYLQELGSEGMRAWQQNGFSAATGLGWEVIEDADASDLANRLHRITAPLLITHGTADESVPIAQSRKIRDRAGGKVDLLEMKGTNHHYSDRNDWDRMAAIHATWIKKLFCAT